MPKKLVSSSSSSAATAATSPTLQQSASALASSIPSTFTDTLPLPSLLVFDLDYTLWPFWVDFHPTPPLKPTPPTHTAVTDRTGETFAFHPEVPSILVAARAHNIPMSLASRTETPELARDMLKMVHIPPPPSSSEKPQRAIDYFVHAQMYPGNKTTHFARIQEGTRRAGREVAFADMLFFDDEARNRDVETRLGVTMWLVRDGMSREEVDKGVWEWRRRRGIKRWAGRPEGGAVELEA